MMSIEEDQRRLNKIFSVYRRSNLFRLHDDPLKKIIDI